MTYGKRGRTLIKLSAPVVFLGCLYLHKGLQVPWEAAVRGQSYPLLSR